MKFNLLALTALYCGSATAILHARSFEEGYHAGLAARDTYDQQDSLYARDFDLEDSLWERDLDVLDTFLHRRIPMKQLFSKFLEGSAEVAKNQAKKPNGPADQEPLRGSELMPGNGRMTPEQKQQHQEARNGPPGNLPPQVQEERGGRH